MMPKKNRRLLLISHHNSYRIAPYIKAARNLGLDVSIASEGEHSLVSEVANGIHINFTDLQITLAKILEENDRQAFCGILGSDDQTVELAAHIAGILGLVHNPVHSAACTRRKDIARSRLFEAGCPVPDHRLLDLQQPLEAQLNELTWPCVLKPLNMSASRGVIRADDIDQMKQAALRIQYIIEQESDDTFEQTHLLVEEYIDGIEIAFEGYLQNGTLEQITIFDKPDPLTGPYFAETIYLTPSSLSSERQSDIKDTIKKACDAYGLVTGAVHAECRIDKDGKVWILEIATRTIGGDCARILDGDDFNLEELAVKLAIGDPVTPVAQDKVRAVMMIPIVKKGLLRRVEGLLDANRIEHIDSIDVIINEGHELTPLPEGNQYLGYIFASGGCRESVLCSVREAYATLNFVTAPVFTIATV